MPSVLESVNLRDPDAVLRTLHAGSEANLTAPCRRASTDVVAPPGRLIATGDLHDNPLHLSRLVTLANLADTDTPVADRAHLILQEVVHSDRLVNGMDLSCRALIRVAALKAAFPDHVHVLLANHELAQIVGAGIVKDGLNVVASFNEGVEYLWPSHSGAVQNAIGAFIRSMPLALRCIDPGNSGGDLLCSHSLPAPELMDRFDATILERDITEDDYAPRRGSAYLMVWGRRHTAEQVESLSQRWGVRTFLLGHEKAPHGVMRITPRAVVLNSDHDDGRYLKIDLAAPPDAAAAEQHAAPLAEQ